ncbi:NAD-dependent epimerase/dehydratase family protein [Streptomyces sp. NPDC014986]|uniref:NAD-dependent epimerase/dehydratase family protein n=1 Tax=Streptomyces sp. NPDC014986 TaxID=3364934 RepID=UPI0036F85D11
MRTDLEPLNRSNDPRGPLIAVLGASGYIGSAVVGELARLPVRVRAVTRGTGPLRADAAAGAADITVCRVDPARPGAVGEAVDGADAVIHLAAEIGGAQSWRSAAQGSQDVAAALMRDVVGALGGGAGTPPALVFASTVQAAATGGTGPGPYARQKIAAERVLARATSERTVRGAVLRLATVFGRSTPAGSVGRGVLTAMTRRAIDGEPLTMWHDGSVERDFLHVQDAARAFVAALPRVDAARGGGPWDVGTGTTARLGDVFSDVAALVAEHTGRAPVPVVSVAPPEYADTGDFHSPRCDPSAFRSVTGWRPRVPLREGLDDLVTAMTATTATTTTATTATTATATTTTARSKDGSRQ